MKIGTTAPERISVAKQRQSVQVFALTNNHATQKLLEALFPMPSLPRLCKENQLGLAKESFFQ
jgi:hypothetical protein